MALAAKKLEMEDSGREGCLANTRSSSNHKKAIAGHSMKVFVYHKLLLLCAALENRLTLFCRSALGEIIYPFSRQAMTHENRHLVSEIDVGEGVFWM
jgi:hypothetical protein